MSLPPPRKLRAGCTLKYSPDNSGARSVAGHRLCREAALHFGSHADDLDPVVCPTNAATKKRLTIALPEVYAERLSWDAATAKPLATVAFGELPLLASKLNRCGFWAAR